MRIPSASFASTLPRMAIPDHNDQGALLAHQSRRHPARRLSDTGINDSHPPV